jgi:hypothetical protein
MRWSPPGQQPGSLSTAVAVGRVVALPRGPTNEARPVSATKPFGKVRFIVDYIISGNSLESAPERR